MKKTNRIVELKSLQEYFDDSQIGGDWELWRAVQIVIERYLPQISKEIIDQVQRRDKCLKEGKGFIASLKEHDTD